jgi:hypothetical protein
MISEIVRIGRTLGEFRSVCPAPYGWPQDRSPGWLPQWLPGATAAGGRSGMIRLLKSTNERGDGTRECKAKSAAFNSEGGDATWESTSNAR